MNKLLLQVIFTGLAASVSPVAIAACINVLLYKNAIRNSLFFLSGFTITLLTIGAAGLLVFSSGYSSALVPADIRGYVDVGFGLLCFGLVLRVLLRRPKAQKNNASASKSEKTMTMRKAFILGVIFMALNFPTIVIYVSGLHLIVIARLGLTNEILAIILLTFITLLTILAPIILYALMPLKAETILYSLRT